MGYEDEAAWRARVTGGLSSRSVGVVADYDWPAGLVEVVDGLGNRQWMAWAGPAPWRGGTVRVLWLGNEPTAFAVYGSAMGTVGSVVDDIATVVGDDGKTYSYPHAVGLTLTNGDRVAVDHERQLVVAQYSAEPPASEFVPGTAPSGPGSGTFMATDSGRWNLTSGVFRDQRIRADADNGSAVFFGTSIRDSVAGRTISRLELRLLKTYDFYPGTVTQLAYHGSAANPGSLPSLLGGLNVTGGPVGAVSVFDLMPWAAQFQSGAALGVGFYGITGQREFGDFSTSSIYGEWS